MTNKRSKAAELAKEFSNRHDPGGWFEELYRYAKGDPNKIPWVDMAPNPNLVSWLDRNKIDPAGKTALKIGCGLGDDAEELSKRGFKVTAFDISQTAINWCKKRFPNSDVKYLTIDLLGDRTSLNHNFDFVLESYTLQVLPEKLLNQAIRRIANFVMPGGTLLVICRGRNADEKIENPPWPLSKEKADKFKNHGLTEISFEDFLDSEEPPVRRFRVEYKR
ncbi:MAG: class I SAM-dependent methyltransferase [candidate division Zixibacteria bacterium]|nr:class I SAM-dependent methyltransferase [candidate division Zixibacteria bacterium]